MSGSLMLSSPFSRWPATLVLELRISIDRDRQVVPAARAVQRPALRLGIARPEHQCRRFVTCTC